MGTAGRDWIDSVKVCFDTGETFNNNQDIRQKTVCLARNTSNVLGVIGGTLENYFMNPNAWNLQGYTGFVWGGCAWVIFIWAYFRLPETKVNLALFLSEYVRGILTI